MWSQADVEYKPFPREVRRDEAHSNGEVPVLLAMLGFPPGLAILELGCGPGATLVPLGRQIAPARLCGIDIDEVLLRDCAASAASAGIEVELHHGDARALPFDDATFDVVLDFGTCYHIAHSARALAEAARVLTRGGVFVTETKLNQTLSHPLRSFGRRLPWSAAPALAPLRRTLMWEARVKQ